MITLDYFRSLLNRQPFLPFRLYFSAGGSIDVRSREQVFLLRHYALIGLLDPGATDTVWDRYATVWYLHLSRVEMLTSGQPPFEPPAGPTETPSPAHA